MKAKEVTATFSGAVAKAKADGLEQISVQSLEAFAADLERIVNETPEDVASSDAALEAHKVWLSSKVLSAQYSHEFDLELLRATVSTAQAALKATILINGGAAAALLAFIGGIWPATPALMTCLAKALILFVGGVASSAIGTALAYLSQAGFSNEFGAKSKQIGAVTRALAILVVLGAFGFFIAGAVVAYGAVAI